MSAFTGSVLLVDDDPSARALLSRVAADMGFTPRSASSRAEARELLRVEHFRVLVTDVSLEESDAGVNLAREARLLNPGLPVILITGYPDLETALPALRSHAFDYLAKPFPLEELRRALRRAMDESEAGEPVREELEAAYSELKKVERLREGMLGILEHELRTPLCLARLAAEELSEEEAGPNGVASRRLLKQGLDRLESTVSDILLHARLTTGRAPKNETVLSWGGLCAMAGRGLAEEALALSVGIEVTGAEEDTRVRGDRAMLAGAVRHLLSNAVRFNKSGGTVRALVERQDGRVVLTVSDEGGGIPPEHLSRIFDPYYQVADYLTRARGGLGLGLAIARAVFEGHGGGISVTNHPGRGCEFRAWLPAVTPDAAG